VLALEEAVIPQEQDQDADSQKGSPEGLPQMPQCLCPLSLAFQRSVETEELCNGDSDRGERQRCSEPCEEGPF
jgi:hypothetical protein